MTRFEKLKEWVNSGNKEAVAEMLAVITNEDSPNDYTKFVPEWLEYLDEEIPVPTPVDEAYERGLNDAWECARKIANMTESEIIQAFGKWFGWSKTFEKYSSSEAMRKIKEWEEERQIDNEIKVGDEVKYNNCMDFGIVTFISNNDRYYILDATGYWMANVCKDDVKKTGRSFPQIAEVFEQLKGDDVIADSD